MKDQSATRVIENTPYSHGLEFYPERGAQCLNVLGLNETEDTLFFFTTGAMREAKGFECMLHHLTFSVTAGNLVTGNGGLRL